MYEDGYESSVPIYQEIENPANLNSILTKIPYDKGAALLFMLEDTVGEDNFKRELKVNIGLVFLEIKKHIKNHVNICLELFGFKRFRFWKCV